jgi:hypothetical protein
MAEKPLNKRCPFVFGVTKVAELALGLIADCSFQLRSIDACSSPPIEPGNDVETITNAVVSVVLISESYDRVVWIANIWVPFFYLAI